MRAFAQLPEGSVRVSYAHKGFMVAAKMVNILVEPLAHRDGLNLYENGALQLAGMLHLIGVTTGLEASHKKMQEAFVGWMRRQTSTDNLSASIAEHRKSVSVQSEELSQWLELLEHCRSVADATSPEDRDDSLDPAVPTLYVIATGFREDLGDFRLVHDDSKVIDRHSANLSSVHLLPDVARPGKFNRKAASHISFADSLDHSQLQIADWTAGAVRQWATWLAVGGRDRFVFGLPRSGFRLPGDRPPGAGDGGLGCPAWAPWRGSLCALLRACQGSRPAGGGPEGHLASRQECSEAPTGMRCRAARPCLLCGSPYFVPDPAVGVAIDRPSCRGGAVVF
ncbi:hypothetical protein [Streptomyces sp. NPDC002746]